MFKKGDKIVTNMKSTVVYGTVLGKYELNDIIVETTGQNMYDIRLDEPYQWSGYKINKVSKYEIEMDFIETNPIINQIKEAYV